MRDKKLEKGSRNLYNEDIKYITVTFQGDIYGYKS